MKWHPTRDKWMHWVTTVYCTLLCYAGPKTALGKSFIMPMLTWGACCIKKATALDAPILPQVLGVEHEGAEKITEKEQAKKVQVAALSKIHIQVMQRVETQEKKGKDSKPLGTNLSVMILRAEDGPSVKKAIFTYCKDMGHIRVNYMCLNQKFAEEFQIRQGTTQKGINTSKSQKINLP